MDDHTFSLEGKNAQAQKRRDTSRVRVFVRVCFA